MTYISRRTRIIVSRWADECDADYILRAVRKRSDGRIKRYSSCDDLRAWVNDYCIKHEHLVELMSDGEFLAGPPFRLFGRFIPVPILFKLVQNFQNNDATRKRAPRQRAAEIDTEKGREDSVSQEVTFFENADEEGKSTLSRVEWVKNRLEKSLHDSTNLLDLALCKLEKIDNIIDLAAEESENAKNEEIQFACRQSEPNYGLSSPCQVHDSNVSEGISSSRTYIKKLQDSNRCNDLLRKISGLREKLKKVQECRQKIMREIHETRVRGVKCESSKQLTELYSRREEGHVKKLKKKLEKLISERGRLLSEMCEALNSLNTFKRTSRSVISRQRNSSVCDREEKFKSKLGQSASCACGCDCSVTSCDTVSETLSESDRTENVDTSRTRSSWVTSNEVKGSYLPGAFGSQRERTSGRNSGAHQKRNQDDSSIDSSEVQKRFAQNQPIIEQPDTPAPSLTNSSQKKSKPTRELRNMGSTPKKRNQQSSAVSGRSQHTSRKGSKPAIARNVTPEKLNRTKNRSKVNFAEKEESPCRKKFYQEDFSEYQSKLTPQQQKIIRGALKKIQSRRLRAFRAGEGEERPRSTPTTARESQSAASERRSRAKSLCATAERRVKSEATMQEIEKTLRNYEQRLRKYDGLEQKIEQIRQKVSEMNQMKLDWHKHKKDNYKELESERGKSSKEIKKLSTENWALKRQVQRLMAKFEVQCKKIQTLKCNAKKNWELECETEELKKELMKYRDKFEHQRKCITEWERVVVLQRKEIENLMNHIRRKSPESCFSAEYSSMDKKNIQRSRSYSPELLKPQRNIRPVKCVQEFRSSSEEEGGSDYCNEYPQLAYASRNQQKNTNANFYPQTPCRRVNW